MRKKFLSALLSLCMVLTLLPCEAFAANVPAHTHQYTEQVSVLQQGSCKDGTKSIVKFKCSVEGCTKTTYRQVDAAHTEPAADQVTTVPATCGDAGSKSYACSVCSATVTETIPATGKHTYAADVVIPATCTENSKVGEACSVCGAAKGEMEEVPGTALGHDFKMTAIKAASCTEAGTQQLKCSRCDATEGAVQTIPAKGHVWKDDGDFQAANCEHPGQQPQKCSACGETQMDIPANEDGTPMAPALGHDYTGAEAVKTEATCTAPAYITKTCTRGGCGYEDKQIDATVNNGQALGHDWKTVQEIKATCQEGGGTLQACQRQGCDETQMLNPTPVDPNGHVISTELGSKSTVLSAADCSKGQNAVVKAVCELCEKSLGYKSVPYEHNYENVVPTETTAPTCTEKGVGTVQCKNVNCTHTETVELPAKGHTWNQIDGQNGDADGWVVTKAPTCGETGLKSRNCSVCDVDDATDVEVPATGEHTYADKVVEATCQHGQSAGSFCETCNAQNPDEEPMVFGDPVAHSYTETVTDQCVDATCTKDGKTVMKCKWCDETQEEVIPATGHTEPDNPQDIEVTTDCVKGTVMKFHCSKCDEDVTIQVDGGESGSGQHTWGDWETKTEATCTTAGSKERTCSVCHAVETAEIAALDHDLKTVTVEATCAEGGYTQAQCQRDDCNFVGEKTNLTEKDPTKHIYPKEGDAGYNGPTYLQEPTCTTSGVELKECSNCHKRTYTSVPAGHLWDEGSETTPATCAAAGVKTFTCERMGCTGNETGDGPATKTEPIPQLTTHTWKSDYTDAEGAPVTNDADGWAVTKPATCGEAGEKKRQCTVEGCEFHTEQTETIPTTSAEHQWSDNETTTQMQMGNNFNACIHDNVAGYICTVCGAIDEAREHEVVTPATGHTWNKWVEVTPSTCSAAGSEKLTCATCNADAVANQAGAPAEVTHELPLAEHTIPNKADGSGPDIELVAGNCEKPGGFKYTCSECGQEVTEYIDDGGTTGKHQWGEWETVTEATCTTKGSKTRTCSKCNETETADIPMAAHTLEVKTVPATCRTEGYTINWCSVCQTEQGNKLSTIPVNANAHVYGDDEGTYLQEPTCTTSGVARKTCTVCGKSSYVKVEAGHKWDNGAVTTPATCTTEGVKTYTCTVESCGANKTEAIDALGHDYPDTADETKSVEPTCGEAGKDVFVCTRGCGVDKEEVVPATGEHTYETSTIEATCTAPAKAGDVCSVCGAEDPEHPMEVVDGSAALGHQWGAWTTSKPATCTEDGEETRTCTRQGCKDADGEAAKETRIIKAAHTPGTPTYTPADCENPGHVVTECDVCHEVLEDEDLSEIAPALGHKSKEIRVEPTCTEDGSTKTICERCGEVLVEETVLPANGEHAYEIRVIQASTCSAKGIGRPTCKNCGATKPFVALPLAEHTWGADEVRGEEIWHTCDVCGAEEKVGDVTGPDDPNPPACEHVWTVDPADATKHTCSKCSTSEAHDYGAGDVCTKCSAAKPTDPNPSCEHVWTVDSADATKHTCGKCGATEAHAWTVDPADSTKHKCSKCSTASEAHTYDADGNCTKCEAVCPHTNTQTDGAQEATCTEAGSTGTTVCTDCGKTVAEAEVIPAKQHNYVPGKYEDETDLDDDGNPRVKDGQKCSNCNDIVWDTTSATLEEAAPVKSDSDEEPASTDPVEPAVE